MTTCFEQRLEFSVADQGWEGKEKVFQTGNGDGSGTMENQSTGGRRAFNLLVFEADERRLEPEAA